MAVFPLFVDLKGKTCVIIGGGEVASRKVEILMRFEVNLIIIAPKVCSSINVLAKLDKLKLFKKEYNEQDNDDVINDIFDEAFIIIAATSSNTVNESVYKAAKKRNILVNVVDDPLKCSFIFPSVILRGDLSIGISTSGNYPALSKKIRKITEEIFNEEYPEILQLFSEFRIRVRSSNLDQSQRKKVLKQVVDEFYNRGIISSRALRNMLGGYEKNLSEGSQC